jgi:ABC-2 type transport system ATP-binding protein
MADEPLLEARNYGRQYRRGRWAVRDLSFVLADAGITALIGPNGAGKSTLLRACVGFEPADQGTILIRGIPLDRRRRRVLHGVAYVPQEIGLYPGFSPLEHFAMAGVARPGFDRAAALRVVEVVGVDPSRPVGELSVGQQALVAVALALACPADLVLLDEPLASLDPMARRALLGVLAAGPADRRRSVLLSSHLVHDVEPVAERVLVLAAGRLVLDARVAELIQAFEVVEAPASRDGVVGTFAGPRGESLALVRAGRGGRRPSLEEIVLGHLAAEPPRR